MAGVNKIALVYICLAAEVTLVQCCLRTGPSHEDFKSLKEEVQFINRQLHNLESKHENFVSESRNRKSNAGATTGVANDAIASLKDRLVALEMELGEPAVADETTNQLIKKTVDNLEKQINDKIKTMNDALSEMEKKSTEDHAVLENSLKTLDKSMKKKLEEFHNDVIKREESSQEKHTFVLESLEKLNNVVNSDLKAKVSDFDKHITSIRTAKDEADKLLSELQSVVERIRPNTFNKESAVKAFLILVAFVLILAFWMYKIQQNVTELKKYP